MVYCLNNECHDHHLLFLDSLLKDTMYMKSMGFLSCIILSFVDEETREESGSLKDFTHETLFTLVFQKVALMHFLCYLW